MAFDSCPFSADEDNEKINSKNPIAQVLNDKKENCRTTFSTAMYCVFETY